MVPLRALPRRRFLLAAGLEPLLHGAEDAEAILARALSFDAENYRALRSYVWQSEEISYRGKREIRQQKYEVNLLSGSMYWRKLEQMHQPLRGADAEMEAQRLRRHLEGPRGADGLPPDEGWRFERAFLEEIPKLHRIAKFEASSWESTPCYFFDLIPEKDPALRHPFAAFAASFRIRVWLSQENLQWVHSEWEAVKKVSWRMRQLPLGRLSMIYSNGIVYQGELGKGGRFAWTLTRIPNGPWTLASYQTSAGSFRNELRYFAFRRFSSESELLLP